MCSSARHWIAAVLVFAVIVLVGCEAADAIPTPRPTWTPRAITTMVAATEVPAETPTPEPTTSAALAQTPSSASGSVSTPAPTSAATATPASASRLAAPAPLPAVRDPLLPLFGPFPPIPIPNRPANINPLTGLAADPALLQRRPIVARIGNDQIVRTNNWHAGLSVADLVFEELIDVIGTNYATTRYSAVFLSTDPPLIGPIRSGRIVNFQIVPMLDGALAHAGASDGTRWLFSQTPMINLDEYFNQPAYCYMDIKSRPYYGRLYTTAPRLREWLRNKGWEAPVPLYGFTFSDRAPAGSPSTTITLNKAPWPSAAVVQWKYDAASGKYLRFTVGVAHMDTLYNVTAKWGNGADCVAQGGETQTQIRATNVVVLYAKHEKTDIIEDSNNAVSVHIILTGQGDAQIFRDGVMIQGKWQRQSEQEFFRFVDASGNTIALKPGNTWFEIVPIGYQPDLK
jgi:hypothetical protein